MLGCFTTWGKLFFQKNEKYVHTKKVQFSDNKFNISLCLLLVWFPAPSNTFPSFPNSRDLLDPLHYNCGKNFLLLVWKCGFRENEIFENTGNEALVLNFGFAKRYKKDVQYQFQTFYFSDNTERKIYFEDTDCINYCSLFCVQALK